MEKKSNLICTAVSLLPIMVLAFLYNNLGDILTTNISGSNGMMVSKNSFVLITTGFSILSYYIAAFLSQKLSALNAIISQPGWRILLNLFFAVLGVLLVLSNK